MVHHRKDLGIIELDGQSRTLFDVTVRAHNYSEAPIYKLALNIHSPIGREHGVITEMARYLLPGAELETSGQMSLSNAAGWREADFPQTNIGFRDADGYLWQKFELGALLPHIDQRPRTGLRGRLWQNRWLGPRLSRWAARPSRPPVRARERRWALLRIQRCVGLLRPSEWARG